MGEYIYERHPVERGYAGRTLPINLNDNTFREKPVTQQMKDLFTGGRGFALKMLWDANSIPTPEKPYELGIDLPEVIEVIEQARKKI